MQVNQTDRMDLLREMNALQLQQHLYGQSRECTANFQRVIARLVQVQKMRELSEVVDVLCKTPIVKSAPIPATATTTTTTPKKQQQQQQQQPAAVQAPLVLPTLNKRRRETLGDDGEMGESLSNDDDDDDDEKEDDDEELLDANGKPLIVDDSDDVEYTSDDSILDDDQDAKFTDSDEEQSEDESDKKKSKSTTTEKHKKTKDRSKKSSRHGGGDSENAPKVRWLLEYRAMCEVRPGYELLVRRMDAQTAKLFEDSDQFLKRISVAVSRVVGNALNGQLLVDIDKESAQRALQYITQLVPVSRIEYVNLGKSPGCAEMPGAITMKAIKGRVYKITLLTDGMSMEEPLTLYEDRTWCTFLTFMFDVVHLDQRVSDMLMAHIAKCVASADAYRRIPSTSWRERVAFLIDDSLVSDIEQYVGTVLSYAQAFICRRNKDAERLWQRDADLGTIVHLLDKVEYDGARASAAVRAASFQKYNLKSLDRSPLIDLESDSESDKDDDDNVVVVQDDNDKDKTQPSEPATEKDDDDDDETAMDIEAEDEDDDPTVVDESGNGGGSNHDEDSGGDVDTEKPAEKKRSRDSDDDVVIIEKSPPKKLAKRLQTTSSSSDDNDDELRKLFEDE